MKKAKVAKPKKPFGEGRFVIVGGRCVRMLAPFISSEETRYYLGGIHFEANGEGIIGVATDGHRMGIVRDASGKMRGSWICPVSKPLLTAIANEQKAERAVCAAFIDRSVYLIPCDHAKKVQGTKSAEAVAIYSEILPPIDGTYPDWKRILPAKIVERHRPITVNVRLLAAFDEVKAAASVDGASGWQFHHMGGERDPLFVRHPRIPEFAGIIMPMHGDRIEAMPEWLPKAA